MAEVVVPQLAFSPLGPPGNRDSLDYAPSQINHVEPSPLNDTFMFQSSSSLSPLPHSLGHQPISSSTGTNSHRRKPSNLSIGPMAPFEFGTTTKDALARPMPSPTHSPARLTPPGNHISGHRRGGSEFVGGAIVQGGPVLVPTNVPQDESNGPRPPSPIKSALPTGRGRHSHRRSGAVSQSDIRKIMTPSKDQKADSAPQTPALSRSRRPPGPERSSSFPAHASEIDDRSASPSGTLQPEASQSRSRVGFSEHPEYISRPLSTISSETSSSMSTVRAHHSVSGSVEYPGNRGASSAPFYSSSGSSEISSSLEARSPPDAMLRMYDNGSNDGENANLYVASNDLAFMCHGNNQKPEEIGTCARGSPAQTDALAERPPNHWDVISARPFESPSNSSNISFRPHSISDPRCQRPRTSPESKSSSTQQKGKSWTDKFHRKDRQATKEATHVPDATKSVAVVEPESFSLDYVDLDNDNTTIIEESDANPSGPLRQHLDDPNLRLGQLSPASEQPSHMLDLDALGTLGSPSDDPASADYFNKSSVGKRRLHSSGETGGFMGPGMHYHRRADSAPEMEAVERPRIGVPRLGSKSKMDVDAAIEEEEEEEDNVEVNDIRREDSILGLGVNVVDCEAISEEPLRRRTSGTSTSADSNPLTAADRTGVHDSVEIVEAGEEPRYSVLTKSSDESTITPTLSPDASPFDPASGPLDSALPTPSLTYGTTPETPSAVSSADYHKTSFDVHDPRIHTASSSVTGTTLESSKIINHAAASIDDVPSLTSSASTMLNDHPDRFSNPGNAFYSNDRSASLSAAVPARTRNGNSSKRSSLASLSKLVVGSYNKSKLNIAETATPDTPERKAKKKHRISRMMTFWKPKDKLTTG